jgi:hypothetical protein
VRGTIFFFILLGGLIIFSIPIRVTNKKPNSFTNPPNFALPSFSYFLILPRLAFIYGRIALIFQNPLPVTTFFRNFAAKFYKYATNPLQKQ